MKSNVFLPSALAVAVSLALVGCGGGGGGSTSTPPPVTQPPVDGGNGGGDTGNGGGDTGNGGGDTGNGGGDTGNGGEYNPADYDVTKPDTSGNKVAVGVLDSGVEKNAYLDSSVQKVLRYIEDYQSGKLTITDLTEMGIDVQDISANKHGTLVAQIIAGKKFDGSPNGMMEGLAKDIAEIYGVSTSETGSGLGFTSASYQAALDLNEKYGVKLFNASFGTSQINEGYAEKLTQYAVRLANGGSLVVMATGNDRKDQPSAESLLPNRDASIEKGWLAVTGLNKEGNALYDDGVVGANKCGDAARWCLSADYVTGPLASPNGGLVYFLGTSGATPQVTSAAALVWSAFPWMTNDQVRQSILTNADYIDDGSGLDKLYNETFGWGKLNIDGSVKGPKSFLKMFGDNFDANVTSGLAVFSNDIDGDAGLIKNGSGTLALTGDSTYSGLTTVNDGKLQVTGSIQSDVDVNRGGTLSGKGTVGSVNNNGTVSTYDGRLTVNGDYTQASNATLEYSLNNHLTVKGEAVLDGTLAVGAKDSSVVTKGEHLVLDADSVVGKFHTTKSTSAFLTVKDTIFGADSVLVDIDFANAGTAGTVLGGISDASGLLTNMLMELANEQALNGENTAVTEYVAGIQRASTQAQAQAVLNSNAGALFAETPSVLLRNDSLVNAQIAQRTRQVTKQGQSGVWASTGYLESQTGAVGWDTVDSEIFSTTVGADAKIGENGMIGAFVTDYQEKSKFDRSTGSSEVDMLTLGLYGKWTNPGLYYASATAQYGLGDAEFNRQVTSIAENETSVSEADLDKFGVYAELGQEITKGKLDFIPYAGLSYNQVSMDSLKETSNMGVSVADLTAKEAKSHLGFRADYAFNPGLVFGGYVEYAYAFDRNLPTVYLASNLAPELAVGYEAPEFDKDFLMYGLSFNYQAVGQNWNIFGDASGNALNNGDYQVQLGLKYAF